VKLPIGVADLDSLGAVVIPCEPMCAVTALPCLRQPPAAIRSHACKIAVVRLRDWATTVMTRFAEPVE
jgi:hypothetical protein